MKQSPSTCLRIISNLPVPVCNDKEIIGIDDWAFRKGVSYGTIVADAMSGRPIDLIESREDPEVTSWLKNHKEIKIVTRDRASSYSKAITTALPSCDQIADRQKPAVLFDTLSARKISIYVSNPELGSNKAGLACRDHSLINTTNNTKQHAFTKTKGDDDFIQGFVKK